MNTFNPFVFLVSIVLFVEFVLIVPRISTGLKATLETHGVKGKEGESLDQCVRIANDILFNPSGQLSASIRSTKIS